MQKGKRADTETNNTGSTTQEQPRQNLEPQAQQAQAAVRRQILPELQQQDGQHNEMQKGKRSPNKNNNTGPTIQEQHTPSAQNTKQKWRQNSDARSTTQGPHKTCQKGREMQGGYHKAGTTRHGTRKLNTHHATKIRDLLQKNSPCTSMQDPQYAKGVAQRNAPNTLIYPEKRGAKQRTEQEARKWIDGEPKEEEEHYNISVLQC